VSHPPKIGNVIETLAGLKPASFSNVEPEDEQNSYILNLTDAANLAVLQFTTNALLVSQYAKYQDMRADGTSPAAALAAAAASIAEQELARGLNNMTIAGRPVFTYLNLVEPIDGVIDLPNPPGRFLTFAEAQTEGLPLSSPLPTIVNGGISYTAKLTDYYHYLSIPFPYSDELIKDLIKDELPQWIKDLITDGTITDELLQWLVDHFDDPDIRQIIQDWIDNGLLKDKNGKPIAIPTVTPPGSNPQPTQTPTISTTTTVKSACLPVPVLIATGSGTLRSAIDAAILREFPDYNSTTLRSVSLLFSGNAETGEHIGIINNTYTYTGPKITIGGVDHNFSGGESFTNDYPPVLPVFSYDGISWYREELTIGGESSPIGSSELTFTFSSQYKLQPHDGIDNDGTNTYLWLSCFAYTYACGAALPYSKNASQLIAEVGCWLYATARTSDIWRSSLGGLGRPYLTGSGASGYINVSGSMEMPGPGVINTVIVSVGYNVSGSHGSAENSQVFDNTVSGPTAFSVSVPVPTNDGVYDINIRREGGLATWTVLYSVSVTKS